MYLLSLLQRHGRRAAVVLALGAAALQAHATQTVNIGVQPATQPIYIAKAAGLLAPLEAKYDVRFQLRSFSYGAPENQAMAAGELDLASAGMGPAVVAAARLPVKLLGITILEQTALFVAADSPVRHITDLKGKRVAYPGEGSQQYPLLLKALQDAGMKPSDIELFKTSGSQVSTLVEQGSADAGITWDPHISRALASGKARVLLKAEKILPLKSGHYLGNGFYGRTAFIDANPDLVREVMGAIIQAIDLINREPEKAIALWSKEIGIPAEVIRYSMKQGISVYDADIVPSEGPLAAYTSFLKEAGILQQSDTPKLAPEFAARALAERKP
jgi:ABC-type nitrate/sulfonate/bicarbonate transport system substrate-binding protein